WATMVVVIEWLPARGWLGLGRGGFAIRSAERSATMVDLSESPTAPRSLRFCSGRFALRSAERWATM
ncbi:MAG: hypothetical protein AAGG48_28805, partial [Planctomycetota bacterium]